METEPVDLEDQPRVGPVEVDQQARDVVVGHRLG
jgi:hypothetical protein